MPETSTWTALRNAAFRRLWVANLVSGSAIAAHGTAAFWVLSSLGKSESTLFLSLMATLSALPFSLFTLPAGAIADLADRKKILIGVSLWQVAVATSLAILGFTHLLSSYVILASAFLFGVGFAFGSPAFEAVVAEMVSAEDLPAANNLGGLRMNIAGIVGPALGGLLIPLVGANSLFAFNGLGFLLVFIAILQWKRAKRQSRLPLENFFESFITAIRYVRYTPGIKIILARSALFSFFISIIAALMPVVGLQELHLEPANLGFLFTSMAIGSVVTAIFILPWARSRYAPQRLTTYANASLIVVCVLMATIRWTKIFLIVAALAGVGWTLASTELWVAGQRAMPEWARGRMNATIIMISQAATALGSFVWGMAANYTGVLSTFLVAAGLEIVAMIITRLPAFQLSIDFTADLRLEPAQSTIFLNRLSRLPQPEDGPLSITTAIQVEADRRGEFFDLAGKARLIYLRNGAYGWHLKEDLAQPNSFQIEIIVPSWTHNLRQRERVTRTEMETIEKLHSLNLGPNPPEERISLHLDKEVLVRGDST
ncbi:MAG: MFS transporter [Verrucomicrobia bacterium]|nr:MFS transporter [Verrucomicrobiota bacterium]